jgi:hypothetical protein
MKWKARPIIKIASRVHVRSLNADTIRINCLIRKFFSTMNIIEISEKFPIHFDSKTLEVLNL